MHSKLNTAQQPAPRRLLGIQALVAFNDNFAKFGLLGLVATTLTARQGEFITTLTAAFLIAPFIFLAPLASWLTGRYSREQVIFGCLIAQSAICMALALGGLFENIYAVLITFGLLACQSACFSPAKQAILKEWVGPRNLGKWVAWMGLSSVLGILLGSTLGGLSFDALKNYVSPYHAYTILGLILTSIALGSLLAFAQYRNTEGPFRDQIFSRNPASTGLSALKQVIQNAEIRSAALGIATFYAFGGFLLVCLSQIVRSESPGTAASEAGLFAASLGFGFMLGSLLVGYLQRTKIADYLTPLACSLVAASTFILYGMNASDGFAQNVCLLVIGSAGAGLVLPMQSLIQLHTEDRERGPIITQVNALTNILSLSLLGLHTIANYTGFDYRLQLSMAATLLVFLSAYLFVRFGKSVILAFAHVVASCIYKVKVKDAENLPREGGVLLVANHLSWADAVIITLASHREVKFMGSADLLRNKWIQFIFNFFGVIPVSPSNAREAINSARKALNKGHCVCIFPEGGISQTGMLHSLKKGAILIARQANATVVPVFIDRIWGSVFSYSDNQFFKKRPRRIPYSVNVDFGRRISPQEVTTDRLRDQFSELSYLSMTDRVKDSPNILQTAIHNLKKGKGPIVIDRTISRRIVTNRQLLALSIHLQKHIEHSTTRKRIGFALPMSSLAIASNIGAHITGKVPVFLNTTTSPETWASYAQTAEFDTIITVSKLEQTVRSKAAHGVQVINVEHWLKPNRVEKISAFLRALWLPTRVLTRNANPEEATVLFTSGSSGIPKGVTLSPENILANCLQVKDCAALRSNDRILANLPPFHSFGYTMGCWMPLISGHTLITTPNPLDTKTTGTAIEEESATLFLATPTFLRAYVKKTEASALRSLRAVIAGAERLPESLRAAWETKFDSEILLGYGMTEASPVISLNVSDPGFREGKIDAWRKGKRAQSSGRLLPGIRARLVDPGSGEIQYGCGRGILEIQGANISPGYLHNEIANKERFREAWLHTGDIVRIDEDGFLFIEGRISRFAKIGGEMVPLDAVERQIETILSKLDRSNNIAISTSHDEQKGEKLVLFSEEGFTSSELRTLLSKESIPNLWIPRDVIHLPSIPKLASGKIDYTQLNETCSQRLTA